MRKYVVRSAAVVLCLLTLAVARPAQAQLGVAAGLNFENIGDIDTGSSDATVDNATGWHAGVFYDLPLGPVGIRPGVFYSRADNLKVNFNNTTSNFDLTQVRVPIDIRYMFAPAVVRPYVLGAPVFSFTSAEGDFEDNVKDLQVAAEVGAGISLELGGLRLMPEIRYAFGISNIFEDQFELPGGTTVSPENKQKTFMLRLGVVL